MDKKYNDIVKSALSGDESAFEKLYTMTKDSAYFIALSMTHNEEDAMDILQDSYIKAFTRLNTLDKPELFESWLKRIVVNCCNDFLKRKKILLFSEVSDDIKIDEFDEETDTELIPHESVDKKEASRLIMEIINGLDENKRLVIMMYYYNNMTTTEIAKALEISVSTTKYYLSAARKEIKAGLEKLDKEGTRLYAVIPFTIFPSLIGQAAGNANAPVFSVVSKKVMAGVNAGGGTSAAATSTVAKVCKSVFLKTTASKIIAGAVAVAIGGGGVTAAVIVGNNQSRTVETSQTLQQDNSLNSENLQEDNTGSQTVAMENSETSTESDISISEESSESSETSENSVADTSVSESEVGESSRESSGVQSVVSSEDESGEQSGLIDYAKYPRPQIDDSKILGETFTYYISHIDFINASTIDFIMENFNERVYEKDEIIDVKSELSSYDNPEIYYDIYGCIYDIILSKTLEPFFDEIERTVDLYRFIDQIDEDHNLILKPNKTFKLYIYFNDEDKDEDKSNVKMCFIFSEI